MRNEGKSILITGTSDRSHSNQARCGVLTKVSGREAREIWMNQRLGQNLMINWIKGMEEKGKVKVHIHLA